MDGIANVVDSIAKLSLRMDANEEHNKASFTALTSSLENMVTGQAKILNGVLSHRILYAPAQQGVISPFGNQGAPSAPRESSNAVAPQSASQRDNRGKHRQSDNRRQQEREPEPRRSDRRPSQFDRRPIRNDPNQVSSLLCLLQEEYQDNWNEEIEDLVASATAYFAPTGQPEGLDEVTDVECFGKAN
jgi:hypothetical protein